MKVCMFAPALSLWSPGGVAEHTYQLSRNLVELGCEVHVVCKTAKGRSKHEVVEGIQVHHLVRNRGPPWLFFLKGSVLKSLSKEWEFDLFHSQGPCGALLEVEKPLLATLHGTSADEATEVLRDLADMPRLGIWNFRAYLLHALAVPSTYLPTYFLKRTVKSSTRIIAVSQYVKRRAQKVLQALPEKTEVIYNGAPSMQRPTASPKKEAETQTILYVGYLGVRKGLPYLISALQTVFKENKKAQAVIVGNGSLKPLCQYMVAKLNIASRVTFTGEIKEKEKIAWFQQADLCVIPSTYEAFPIVAVEALSAGKPVVASNVGGLPEVIHNKVNGLLVQPRNPRGIAQAINIILSDQKLASEMTKNALLSAQRDYGWEHIAQKTLNAYRFCVGETS